MTRLAEAERCLFELLGSEPVEVFCYQMEDLKCYSKALSLTDLSSDMDEIKRRLEIICQAILVEVVNIYLRRDYSDQAGSIEVNVTKREVYDKDMNLITPLKKFQENQEKIITAMMFTAIPIFSRGRDLALKIIKRKEHYLDFGHEKIDTLPEKPTRDYIKYPPRELLSIEIMRLERKLPNLSHEEGLRLSELYQKV